MKKFFKDFKAFISRGNILDMAVGVIIGGAFSAIVTAFTNKIIMPLINWVLMVISGGEGLEGAYTFLSKKTDADGVIDLANSIYIDWGAFITAILNFLIIALTLFIILKVAMSAQGYLKRTGDAQPTKAEKKELRESGVNMKNHSEVIAATKALRDKKKAEEEAEKANSPVPPTQEELLANILEELKKQNGTQTKKDSE